jgi:hypothetical protein
VNAKGEHRIDKTAKGQQNNQVAHLLRIVGWAFQPRIGENNK